MSQRGMQLVIGRLITERMFRERVARGGSACLASLRRQGVDLNRTEIAALIEVNPRVWASMARQIGMAAHVTPAANDSEISETHLGLTEQQRHVLAGVCEGLRNQEIASHLGTSEGGVKATLQQLFRKFAVRGRVRLIRVALDNAVVNRAIQGRPRLIAGVARGHTAAGRS